MSKTIIDYKKTLCDKESSLDHFIKKLAEAKRMLKQSQNHADICQHWLAKICAAEQKAVCDARALRLYVDYVSGFAGLISELPSAELRARAEPNAASLVDLGEELVSAQARVVLQTEERRDLEQSLEDARRDVQVYIGHAKTFTETLHREKIARDAAEACLRSMERLRDGTLYPTSDERRVTATKIAGLGGPKRNLPHYSVSFTCKATLPTGYLQDLPAARCIVWREQLLAVGDEVCTFGMLGCAPVTSNTRHVRAVVYDALAATSDKNGVYLRTVAEWLRGGCPEDGALVEGCRVVRLTGDGLPRSRVALVCPNQLEDPTGCARGAWKLFVRAYPSLFRDKKRKAEDDREAKRRA